MPRGSSTNKRQQGAANQRDTRHENGLVVPGKRTPKQKSIGQLNGHACTPDSTPSTPALPATPPITNRDGRNAVSAENIANIKITAEPTRRKLSISYSECSPEMYLNISEGQMEEHHRQIDVNASKNPAVHRDLGPLSLALTVLRSCPLGDTLAILIVLLQIPPTFLSLIHLLFATLTFVPSLSVASGLNLMDILQATLGAPSFGTLVFLDLVVLLLWLFMWHPIQDFTLDLAQTVIALTLGGGTSEQDSEMKNVLWCFTIMGASHLVRTRIGKTPSFRSVISSNLASSDPDDPLEPVSNCSRSSHGWIQSILAVHILTQGVVRCVRDWYLRREKRDISSSLGDPEAGKIFGESSSDLTVMPSADHDPSTSGLGASATSKKKKKHSALVRIRQPLWAALASTKIVMVKEYETSHTAAESAGTNATLNNNLGNAPFNTEPERIWITAVGPDQVCFSASFFPAHAAKLRRMEEGGRHLKNSIVDISTPFFVKVNNTVWQATKINSSTDVTLPAEQVTKWKGEIFGLAPTSNYYCEFMGTLNNSVIFSASVRTLQAPTTDPVLTPTAKTEEGWMSPVATVQASIASEEGKLEEDRQRQKGFRKDYRSKINAARRELDRLASNIASTGGNDDKLRQKAQQSNLHMKQADEAAANITSEIEAIQNLPSDDTCLYSESKYQIQSQREKHKTVRSEFNSTKHTSERDIQNLQNDSSGIQQKTEAKQQRLNFLNMKHESITDANAKGLSEAQRREAERAEKRSKRSEMQVFYTERLLSLSAQIFEGQTALNAVNAAIETVCQVQQDMLQNNSPSSSSQNVSAYGDVIPKNTSMNTYAWNPPGPLLSMFSASGYAPMLNAAGPGPILTQGHRSRCRSSSMLSNVSKFTQSSEEGLGQSSTTCAKKFPVWEDAREDRKSSSGSGSRSGSGSGTGSVADPKSPTVAHDQTVSKC